ncbi:MAG: Cyclopropane-fatty-acyl-phospholipid synthase [Phenylobacterium sp.]|nr:Cyclopropane-fatty-acyl-phospholipid synthase [Phenylobacterium sp.]
MSTQRAAAHSLKSGPWLARPVLRRVADHWRDSELVVDLPGRPGAIRIAAGGPGSEARWTLRNWRAARRVLTKGDLGFAAGYLAGDWETPDLAALLNAVAANYDKVAERLRGLRLLQLGHAVLHALNRNSRSGARRNILAHYDLGNDFYQLWLDPGMTYSSALFATADEPLDAAQRRKYGRIAQIAGVRPGADVLEVGCGWGGFAAFAAGELGAKVTAITLSPAQQAYAQARLFRAGLAERVEVRLVDYRDVAGRYDAVVSIEMFEAVGEAFWPVYFQRLAQLLKPGGRAGLQVITIRDDLFEDYQRRPDFIQLEIFPGGMLPTQGRLAREAGRAGLSVSPDGWARFGQDYARTLAAWREGFDAAWPQIAELGFDARFRRLWRYYLAYCEAGFRSGRTEVVQVALQRG